MPEILAPETDSPRSCQLVSKILSLNCRFAPSTLPGTRYESLLLTHPCHVPILTLNPKLPEEIFNSWLEFYGDFLPDFVKNDRRNLIWGFRTDNTPAIPRSYQKYGPQRRRDSGLYYTYIDMDQEIPLIEVPHRELALQF